MIRLRLFAGPVLEAVDGASVQEVLKQPKLLALLSYLSLEDRYVSRHTLLAMFWPGSSEERGRAALRKMTFLARRSLGDDVLLNRGDHEVGISRVRLRCDAVEFQVALRGGDTAEALRLYRGELLPGFYIRGAPDFERWLEGERFRLSSMALHEALTEAQTALLDEDYEAVLGWARRLREISPGTEEGPLHTITALLGMGEHARALSEYNRYVTQLRNELGTGPSVRMRALAATIRSAAGPSVNPRSSAVPSVRGESAPSTGSSWDTFVENASDLMFEVDTQLYITRANPASSRLLGYSPAELTGMSWLHLIQPDQTEAALAFYMRQLEDRTASAYCELPARAADGRLVWLGQNARLVENAGTVVGIQVVARDVTIQMRMAEVQRHLSLRDRLTDLYGPRGFHSMAEDRIKLAVRTRHKLLLLCLDVKLLDLPDGRAATVAVARLLEATFRASDVIARVDELRFAVLALEPFDRLEDEWLGVIERRLQQMALEDDLFAGMSLKMGLVFAGDATDCDAQRLLSSAVSFGGRLTNQVLPPAHVLTE